MKKIFCCLLMLINVIIVMSQPPKTAVFSDLQMETRIENILQKMSLVEKVGQMCELTVGVITDTSNPDNQFLSEALMDTVFGKYKVGSILNIPYGMGQKKEIWADVITRIQKKSLQEIGIPCIYGVDQIHGASYTVGATIFPQGINMGATFNRELVKRSAEICAYESRACCIPWTYSPVVDLGRDPRWPRMWENYGEDAYVNAQMGVAMVQGYQGDNPNKIDEYHIASCVKHFMGYGVPVSGKDRTPSSITNIDLREKHFAPYLAAIRAGALTLMVNSASNNGMPFHANKELLTQWVKEDLNWDGVIVTDWNDINNLYEREHIAKSKKDAVRIAINAGIDMAMVPSEWQFCIDLKELVEEGKVSIERIDDAVRRVLRLKFRLGLFDNPYGDVSKYDKFACQEFAQVALKAAEESEVLLKNEDRLLPLSKRYKILLTGPNANSMRCLNGGWSISWQGSGVEHLMESYNTIYEALCNKFGKEKILYEPGVTYATPYNDNWWEENEPEIERAVAAANQVDVIIACIGENSYCETPGNLSDLNLSSNQKKLVKALATTGKPIILILNEGRPRILNELEPLAKAIVNIMLPGNYGGDALANLLAGDANFSGRLPFTYPRFINSLATYDYKPSEKVAVMAGEYNYDAKMDIQWPFGFGLSYSEIIYSNFRVDKSCFKASDKLVFTIDVTNRSKLNAHEAVLLYSTDLVASSVPDVSRLRQFEKIELNPGEAKTVMLALEASDLAFVGYDSKWRLEEGEFRIKCGSEILYIRCVEDYVWDGPNIE